MSNDEKDQEPFSPSLPSGMKYAKATTQLTPAKKMTTSCVPSGAMPKNKTKQANTAGSATKGGTINLQGPDFAFFR